MATRTNQQVTQAIIRFRKKHQAESLATALYRYWIRYDLTADQMELLTRAKSHRMYC